MFTLSVVVYLVILSVILVAYDIIVYKYIKLMNEFIDFYK